MNYFNEKSKSVLISKMKKSKIIFLIVLCVFIVVSLLVLLSKNIIGNTISLIILIVLTAIFFSYLLVFVQVYKLNKRIIELHNKEVDNTVLVTGTIKNILSINTINQLQYHRIVVETNDGDRQLFLYDGINVSYNIGDKKNLKVCGNIILGEENYEETID